jgi:hypothetical protein
MLDRIPEGIAKGAAWLVKRFDAGLEGRHDTVGKGIAAIRQKAGLEAGGGLTVRRSSEAVVIGVLLFLSLNLATDLVEGLKCAGTAAANVVGGAGRPACMRDTVDGLGLVRLALALFGTVAAYTLGRWLLLLQNRPAASAAVRTAVPPKATRVLIVGLSLWQQRKGEPTPARQCQDTIDRYRNHPDGIAAALAPGDRDGGPWQQTLRRIAKAEGVECVYVLPSRETDGQVEDFRKYCNDLLGKRVEIRRVRGVDGERYLAPNVPEGGNRQDYEDYNYVYNGLARALEQATEEIPGLERSQICIDVTAGQKIFSIAGGVLTLNSKDMVFSYVTTQPPETAGEVRYYDAEIVFTDRLQKSFRAEA